VLSVPAAGLGLATAELCGAELSEAELCEGDAAATDYTVATEVAGSRVSVITPEPEVQLASRTPAMASAAVIAADPRLGMKAPRDAADTLSDYGRFERGRFITRPQRVNLITRGALKIQASEQGTTHRPGPLATPV